MEGDIDLREFGVEGKIVHCMLYKIFLKEYKKYFENRDGFKSHVR